MGGRVGEESGGLFRGGGQAGEVVRGAAEEGEFARAGQGLDLLFIELGFEEAVDRIATPCGVGDGGCGYGAERLVGPVLFLFGPVVGGLGGRDRAAGARVRRAHFDPGDEVGDLVFRQGLAGRHLEVFVSALDDFDEQAFLRFARDHGGDAAAAALAGGFEGVEIEAAFGLFEL